MIHSGGLKINNYQTKPYKIIPYRCDLYDLRYFVFSLFSFATEGYVKIYWMKNNEMGHNFADKIKFALLDLLISN